MSTQKVVQGALVIGTLAVLVTASGCTDAIIGDWEAKDSFSSSERNDMTIDDDDTGKATIFFSYGGDNYKADFDIEWESLGDDEYDLEMECDGNCSELDFTMECDLKDEDMDCKGEDMWENYDFEWEKVD